MSICDWNSTAVMKIMFVLIILIATRRRTSAGSIATKAQISSRMPKHDNPRNVPTPSMIE